MAEAILAPEVLGPIMGAVAGTALNSIFMPSPGSAPAVPTIASSGLMPQADSQAVQDAQRKSIAAQIARRGRASTILTQDQGVAGNKLGA